jgi:glucose-6-phosphate 1-dehydrogenase
MIDTLVIFGATGDLTGRFLLPGLAALVAAGRLPGGFQLIGAGREDWTDQEFRRWAGDRLARHGGDLPGDAREAVAASASYARVDVTDPDEVGRTLGGGAPLAVYLALPRRSSRPRSRPCTAPACRPGARWCSRSRSARACGRLWS